MHRCDNGVHQTTSLLHFGPEPWRLPTPLATEYRKQHGGDPFRLGFSTGFQPEDPRLDMSDILKEAPDLREEDHPALGWSGRKESYATSTRILETDIHDEALPQSPTAPSASVEGTTSESHANDQRESADSGPAPRGAPGLPSAPPWAPPWGS